MRKEIEKSKKNEKKSNDPLFDKNQPPRVNRMEISKDADYKLVFDKKMIIPDNMEQLKKNVTSLMGLNKIDSDDLFDIRFVKKSSAEYGNFSFTSTIVVWTEREIALKINFSDPSVVSIGATKDELLFTFRRPEMFRAKDNGQSVEMCKVYRTLIQKQTI